MDEPRLPRPDADQRMRGSWERDSDGVLTGGDGGVAVRVQNGGGASSQPPWTSYRSGERQICRERVVLWELGLLRRARLGEWETKGACLGR
jgi:hypothetical protein